MGRIPELVILGVCLSLLGGVRPAAAQENYEIQVYGAETVAPRHTMLELHTNFTLSGSKTAADGLLPTHHSWHETIEITRGFTDWFETASTSSLPPVAATVGSGSVATFAPTCASRKNGTGRWA